MARDPISKAKQAKLAAFLKKAEFLDRIGAGFELRDVQYTSPTDAVAEFDGTKSGGVVIATTDDNWAHASRLLISRGLAELVSYVPLGRGAVAIKAESPSGLSSPPFVLYPNGEVEPLRVTEPRTPDADSDLLEVNLFLYAIGAEGLHLQPDDSVESDGQWAADVDAGEIFPLAGSPPGHLREHVPGRDGAVLSIAGYQKDVGEGVWRFETSTDSGHSWRRTDVLLPRGRKPIWRHADVSTQGVSTHAVGPGHLQAIAMADVLPDLPLYLWELWRTDDEKAFHRVPLPWNRMPFAGMAFASDGALLLAKVADTMCSISSPKCNRTGRIWRLPPEGSSMKLLSHAPTLFGPHGSVGLDQGGGVIVARTGHRTVAVSTDGNTWSEVTPGR